MLSSLTVANGGGGGGDGSGDDGAVIDINHPSVGEAAREGGPVAALTLHTYIHAQCPVQPDVTTHRRRRSAVAVGTHTEKYTALPSYFDE